MAPKRPVYRQAALDKLASPEELDRLMQITRPSAWILLGGFGSVLLTVLLWSILGSITTPLEQTGILTLSNPVTFVPAPAAGQVVEINVQPGDLIAAERPIARISTADGTIRITSPVNGRVIAVRVKIGEPVNAGTPILSVESFGQSQEQEIIAFVPLEDHQRIRPGMDVFILPSTVEREKYGYLKADVLAVSAFAATREEMLAVLNDESFVNTLASAGPVFEVRIGLRRDANGAYVWSASEGPPSDLVLGTPCLITITIDRERPISKLFNLS